MLPNDPSVCQIPIRIAFEAGILEPILIILGDIVSESEQNYALECQKIALRMICKFTAGCNRCIKSL